MLVIEKYAFRNVHKIPNYLCLHKVISEPFSLKMIIYIVIKYLLLAVVRMAFLEYMQHKFFLLLICRIGIQLIFPWEKHLAYNIVTVCLCANVNNNYNFCNGYLLLRSTQNHFPFLGNNTLRHLLETTPLSFSVYMVKEWSISLSAPGRCHDLGLCNQNISLPL